MRILLTGATGFIGSHVLTKLISLNIPAAIILREQADTWRIQHLLDKVTVIRGDLGDPAAIEAAILNFKPDAVIHLAWYGVENRFRNEYQQLTLNLAHTANLLQILEKTNIKKFIGFGSQGEYGPKETAIDETIIPTPTTLYGAAKLSAYHIFDVFCRLHQIDFAWIRLFSIYGPKDNDSWMIPSIIKQLLRQQVPDLTEGRQTWDFLYVDDAVDAIISVLRSPDGRGIFNLGSGHAPTIKEIVEQIRDAIDPSLKLGFGIIPYRPDQVFFLQANIDRLKKMTGWAPKISLQQGIQQTIAWYQQT